MNWLFNSSSRYHIITVPAIIIIIVKRITFDFRGVYIFIKLVIVLR